MGWASALPRSCTAAGMSKLTAWETQVLPLSVPSTPRGDRAQAHPAVYQLVVLFPQSHGCWEGHCPGPRQFSPSG